MKNIYKNAAVWLSIAIVVTTLTALFVIELEDRLGEYSGLIIVAVAIYSTCLALTGTVVQGVFIKMHYYQLGAAASVFIVGTLTLFITIMLHITILRWKFDLSSVAIYLSIPSYAITTISYFSTRDN